MKTRAGYGILRTEHVIEEVEKAEVAFLLSVAENPAIPAELKDAVKAAIENYIKANNAPMEMLGKRFMEMAKTDEEREFVKQMMDEVKQEQ